MSSELVDRVAKYVVGRRNEIELVVAAMDSRRHLVLEGPPGTGKSTLLRHIAEQRETPFVFVEGNAELTPARLIGTFDPAQVLEVGYSSEAFLDGPLVRALRDGALLYIEEINRIPEETLNVLITVMSEETLHIPRLGAVGAAPGFRFVAAMNPFDSVGTARIAGALHDRLCRIYLDYQTAPDEEMIVASQVGVDHQSTLTRTSVELVRRTRCHGDVRMGSSVRGAIDLVELALRLADLRGVSVLERAACLDAALMSLTGRITVRDGCSRTPEQIVEELWEATFGALDDTTSEDPDSLPPDEQSEPAADDSKEPSAGKALRHPTVA